MRFQRFHYPDPEGDGTDTGDTPDYGNDFTPSDDDAAAEAAVAAAAAAKVKADEAADAKALKDAEELKAGAKKDESKDDADKTDEEKAAEKAAAEAADKVKRKDDRIPASRHKEILDKERERREAVERELAQFKQGKTIAAVNDDIAKAEKDLIRLEEEHAQLSLDGKVKEAAAAMTAIRKLERSIIVQQSDFRIAAAEARAIESTRYDVACDRVEEAFPELKEGSAEFDPEKSKEVVELQSAYKLTGLTPTQALQKAVRLIMGAPETKKQADALKVQPKVDLEDAGKDPKEVEKARRAAAAAKTADAIEKTPASTAKVGLDSDKKGGGAVTAKDAIRMPQADFAKLDEEALAKLRGDDFTPD